MERIAPGQVSEHLETDPVVAMAAPRPDFDGALVQFLVGLLQTTLAPKRPGDWKRRCEKPPAADALREAFDPVADAFELLGDGPRFLQDLTLDDEGDLEELAIEKLLIEAPGENTRKLGKDHFVKAGRVEALCRPCAAAALLTLQINAPSGGQGHRTGLRGGGPLSTLVLDSRSLWHTLWLNVLETAAFPGRWEDGPLDSRCFPWLAPTRTSEKGTGKDTSLVDVHPLQMYWAMPRRIRLRPDDVKGLCSLCGGEDRPIVRRYVTRNLGVNYAGSWEHPLSPHRTAKDGTLLPLHGDPRGLSYRDWLGYALKDVESEIERAAVVTSSEERVDTFGLRLWVFGYDMDNMKARAWLDGTMPLPLVSPEHREEHAATCRNLVLGARYAESLLGGALKEALGLDGWPEEWGLRYWQLTEPRFYRTLRELSAALGRGDDTISLREKWHSFLVRTAKEIFDELTNGSDVSQVNPGRVCRAGIALGRNLYGKKMRAQLGLPEPRKTDPTEEVAHE